MAFGAYFKSKPEVIGNWFADSSHAPVVSLSPSAPSQTGNPRVVAAFGKRAQIFEYAKDGGARLLLGKAKIDARARVTSAVRVGDTTLACGTEGRPVHVLEIDSTSARVVRTENDTEYKPWALVKHDDWAVAVAGQLVSDRVMLEEGEKLFVASASHDNTVVVWDLETNSRFERDIVRLSAAQPGNLLCVTWAFSGDEEVASNIVAGSSNGMVYIWHNVLETDATIAHGIPVSTSAVTCITAHPSEPLVAVGTRDGAVVLVNIFTRNIVHRTHSAGAVKAVAWNLDGDMLAVARNLQQRRLTAHVITDTRDTKGVSFAAASDVTEGPLSTVHFYDNSLRERHVLTKKTSVVTALAWDQVYNARTLFIGTDLGEISLLSL